MATSFLRLVAERAMSSVAKVLREDRDGWRAIAIEQQRLIIRLCEQREADQALIAGIPNLDTAEQVVALMAGSGLRRRAALELHSTLDGDLGLDWLDREHIAMACEEFFSVEIPGDAPGEWQTVADIARSVEACRPIAA